MTGFDHALDPVRRPWAAAVVAVLITALVVDGWYLADPEGAGGTAHTVMTAACFAVAAVGPVLRRVRPRRLWAIQTLSAVCMLATVADEWVEWGAGPFEYSDVMFLSGYGSLILWLVLMSRLAEDKQAPNTLLDTAAGSLGAILSFWVAVLAPLSTLDQLITGAIWAAYPPLDVVLLFLTIHLARRHGRVTPALGWLMAASVLWFVADSVYTLIEVRLAESYDIPLLEAVFLLAHVSLALAMAHPQVHEFAPPEGGRRSSSQSRNRAAIVLLTVSPGLLSTAIPPRGWFDSLIRTLLVGTLLALLFVRLSRTIHALSIAEADSRHRATHDALTGLLNRPAMFDELSRRLSEDSRAGRSTAVLFLDCNDFKQVNDTWGHQAGDTLLQDLAARLASACEEGTTVARLGGDEFVVVASVRRSEEAEALADHIRHVFEAPLHICPDRTHDITPSIGIAVAVPGHRLTPDELVGMADAAMYEAKQRGRGHRITVDAREGGRIRSRVTRQVRGSAAGEDAFDVLVRPIMGGSGYRSRCGWEAVASWNDDDLGEVPPEFLIPTPEYIRLVSPLVSRTLRRTDRLLPCRAPSEGGIELHLRVRVLTSQLRDAAFIPAMSEALLAVGLPSDRVWLEIEEWAIAENDPRVVEAVAAAHAAGYVVCICDVGSGYASLSMLLDLPIDVVRLDRTLVADVAQDLKARRRLAAVLALLRSLEVSTIIADGVSNGAQATVLEELGCPFVVGWDRGGGSGVASLAEVDSVRT